MIRINLLPVPKARQQEALIVQAVVGVVILILMFGACYLIGEAKREAITDVETQITQTKRKIEELKAKVGEVEKYKQKLKSLEEQIGVIKRLQSGRSGPVRMMDELTDLVPRKLWIESFKEGAGGAVTISGQADSGTTIADFLDNLKKSKFFSNPDLASVSQSTAEGEEVHKFGISVKVQYAF